MDAPRFAPTRWALVGAVALLLGSAPLGCSSNRSSPSNLPPENPHATSTAPPAELRPIDEAGLVAKLQQFGGLDRAYAECTAKALYPLLTDAERRGLNQPNPPDAITNVVIDKAQDAGANC